MADSSALQRRLREMARDRARGLAEDFATEIRSRMSRRTGALADSIELGDPVETGDRVLVSVVVTAPYARYQDEGTGVYGPDGRRITGKPLLAFDWPAAGGLVIVHSVAGAPGTHFWSEAIKRWPEIVRRAA